MRMARLLAVAKADERYSGPTHWLYTRTGTFLVPVTGDYLIEMHGGGGGGADIGMASIGGGGGGSGEQFSCILQKGSVFTITVGLGGNNENPGEAGGTTIFHEEIANGIHLEQSGGAGGGFMMGGQASGSLASAGTRPDGGKGNINKPGQTYGDGGNGADHDIDASPGKSGAVIIDLVNY